MVDSVLERMLIPNLFHVLNSDSSQNVLVLVEFDATFLTFISVSQGLFDKNNTFVRSMESMLSCVYYLFQAMAGWMVGNLHFRTCVCGLYERYRPGSLDVITKVELWL